MMGYFNDKIQSTISLLKSQDGLRDCIVNVNYCSMNKPTKLRKPRIAVGMKGIEVKEVLSAGGARIICVRISVDIYLPFNMDASHGAELFQEIAQAMIFGDNMIVSCAYCEDILPKNDVDAYLIKSEFVIEEVVSDGCY